MSYFEKMLEEWKVLKVMCFRLTGSDREKQMEDNLQGIGKGLGNLKNMANNMNVEINRQNNQLDVINEKVSRSHLNIGNEWHILTINYYHS